MFWIHCEDQAKVRMRLHDLQRSVHNPLLTQHKAAVGLKQAIQSVQHCWIAEVDVVDEQPISIDQSINENSVGPAKCTTDLLVFQSLQFGEFLNS